MRNYGINQDDCRFIGLFGKQQKLLVLIFGIHWHYESTVINAFVSGLYILQIEEIQIGSGSKNLLQFIIIKQ